MDLEEYQRLRRRIDERYQADIAALDRIWQLSNGEAVPVRESNSRPEGLEQAVRALLPNIEGVFTKRTVASRLRQADPTLPQNVQNLIGGILRELEGTELRLVRRGKGKRPSEYEALRALPLDELEANA